MADGTFTCPSCRAPYQVVKCERGPETVDHDLTCRSCEAPFPGRDGNFVLKYFMLRKADRVQKVRRNVEDSPRRLANRGG